MSKSATWRLPADTTLVNSLLPAEGIAVGPTKTKIRGICSLANKRQGLYQSDRVLSL